MTTSEISVLVTLKKTKVIIGSSCRYSGYQEMKKSSFINSCKFVIDGGVFVAHAEAGDNYKGTTTKRIPHELTKSIWMVDNRGMPTLHRFQTGEIFAQLGKSL